MHMHRVLSWARRHCSHAAVVQWPSHFHSRVMVPIYTSLLSAHVHPSLSSCASIHLQHPGHIAHAWGCTGQEKPVQHRPILSALTAALGTASCCPAGTLMCASGSSAHSGQGAPSWHCERGTLAQAAACLTEGRWQSWRWCRLLQQGRHQSMWAGVHCSCCCCGRRSPALQPTAHQQRPHQAAEGGGCCDLLELQQPLLLRRASTPTKGAAAACRHSDVVPGPMSDNQQQRSAPPHLLVAAQ
jgi:hypothetical protein